MTKEATEIAEFNSADFDARDEAQMVVAMGGKPTTWIWTFAGPGHPHAIAQTERLARDRLQTERLKEQARVNGKKWKAPEEEPDEVRAGNIKWIVERLIDWSPVKMDGALLPFSAEAATKLLSDPRKADLLAQSLEFLAADTSFMQRSAMK